MKYSVTNDTITVVIDGKVYTVHSDMPKFNDLKRAIFNEDLDQILSLVSPGIAIEAWSKGDFDASSGVVKYKGEILPDKLNDRILNMVREGADPSALTNFWVKLQRNPSMRSVEQLFNFLVHEGIPITPEGNFLAYKSVRNDYKDWHSGTVSNEIGTVHEMPRNKISDDPNTSCHYGFHVGALEYARNFHSGGDQRLIICEVDPADVVCVPYDSNAQKVRVCKYKVIGHYGAQLPSTVFKEDACVGDAPSTNRVNEDRCRKCGLDDYDCDCEGEECSYCGDIDCMCDERCDVCGEESDECSCDLDEDEDEDEELDEDEKWLLGKDKEEAVKQVQSANVDLNACTSEMLQCMTIEALRKYATHDLKIVGASRILGGKQALIEAIIKARGASPKKS